MFVLIQKFQMLIMVIFAVCMIWIRYHSCRAWKRNAERQNTRLHFATQNNIETIIWELQSYSRMISFPNTTYMLGSTFFRRWLKRTASLSCSRIYNGSNTIWRRLLCAHAQCVLEVREMCVSYLLHTNLRTNFINMCSYNTRRRKRMF